MRFQTFQGPEIQSFNKNGHKNVSCIKVIKILLRDTNLIYKAWAFWV